MWSTESKTEPLVVWAIENSPAVRSILRLSLKEPDFQLRFFPGIPDLLDALLNEHVDVLLINIYFWQEDGDHFRIDEIKESYAGSLPLILLAGVFDEYPPSLPESTGCRALLRVPFDSGELTRLIVSLGREGNPQTAGSVKTHPSNAPFPPNFEKRVRRIIQEELLSGKKEYGIPEEPE